MTDNQCVNSKCGFLQRNDTPPIQNNPIQLSTAYTVKFIDILKLIHIVRSEKNILSRINNENNAIESIAEIADYVIKDITSQIRGSM